MAKELAKQYDPSLSLYSKQHNYYNVKYKFIPVKKEKKIKKHIQ